MSRPIEKIRNSFPVTELFAVDLNSVIVAVIYNFNFTNLVHAVNHERPGGFVFCLFIAGVLDCWYWDKRRCRNQPTTDGVRFGAHY